MSHSSIFTQACYTKLPFQVLYKYTKCYLKLNVFNSPSLPARFHTVCSLASLANGQPQHPSRSTAVFHYHNHLLKVYIQSGSNFSNFLTGGGVGKAWEKIRLTKCAQSHPEVLLAYLHCWYSPDYHWCGGNWRVHGVLIARWLQLNAWSCQYSDRSISLCTALFTLNSTTHNRYRNHHFSLHFSLHLRENALHSQPTTPTTKRLLLSNHNRN